MGKRLLKALGHPEDPGWFAEGSGEIGRSRTSECVILFKAVSQIGASLSRADDLAPLPLRIAHEARPRVWMDLSRLEKNAELRNQIHQKFAFSNYSESVDVDKLTAVHLVAAVGHSVALLISLCPLLEQAPERKTVQKQNFNRHFHRSIFRDIVPVYCSVFGMPPRTTGPDRCPQGPATRWVARVLRIAAENYIQSEAERTREMTPDQRIWYNKFRDALLDADQLRMATKAKLIRKAWRHAKTSRPSDAQPPVARETWRSEPE